MERIVSVKTEHQSTYDSVGRTVLYYTVQTEGNKLFRLPAYRFVGVPTVGASMEYMDVDQAPINAKKAYWRIVGNRAR
jgi:hypothetical protein